MSETYKFCHHLATLGQTETLQRAHVSVHMKSSPVHSRADLNERVYLCAVCSGELILLLNYLERGK
jgi:hypothetical protein